jgi:hypothetical protein
VLDAKAKKIDAASDLDDALDAFNKGKP